MTCKNCLDGLFCQNKCVRQIRPDKAKQRRIQETKPPKEDKE